MMELQPVYLEQGSPEWHERRRSHYNASEAGAVMDCGRFKPRNMVELLAVKRGDLVIAETPAMSRGNALEPVARDAVERETGIMFTPAVFTRGRYSASLDGIDFDGRVALEIKCPVKADSPMFSGEHLRTLAPYYWWQIVHQAWVTGVEKVIFAVYHPDRPIFLAHYHRDELAADFDALCARWEVFGKHLDDGTSPEVERTDAEWVEAAGEYRAAAMAVAQAEAIRDAAKARLIELGGGKGFGLSVVRVKGRETVKYADAIKSLAPDADLSKWTTQGKPSWKVTEVKQ